MVFWNCLFASAALDVDLQGSERGVGGEAELDVELEVVFRRQPRRLSPTTVLRHSSDRPGHVESSICVFESGNKIIQRGGSGVAWGV